MGKFEDIGGTEADTPSYRVKPSWLNDNFEILATYSNITNAISILESINQNTILSQEAGITDKTYTYASSDTFSDSNGYNNTIDTANSANAIYNFSTGAFIGGFGNNTIDTEAEEWVNFFNSPANGDDGQSFTTTKAWSSERMIVKMKMGYNHDSVSKIAICSNIDGTGEIDSADIIGETPDGYLVGVFNSISLSDATKYYCLLTASSDLPFEGSYSNTYAGGEVVSNGAVFLTGSYDLDFLVYEGYGNGTIQTNSKTFSSNVKSILVNANKVLNGSSTITVDVSSDGGSTWDVEDGALDTFLELDGDDTDIVVKFNLNVDSGDTPELYGYSYQVWTEEES